MDDLISRQAAIDVVEQEGQKEPCWVCKNLDLENGDTLYSRADWDGGVGFEYICNIKYCPVCGKKL